MSDLTWIHAVWFLIFFLLDICLKNICRWQTITTLFPSMQWSQVDKGPFYCNSNSSSHCNWLDLDPCSLIPDFFFLLDICLKNISRWQTITTYFQACNEARLIRALFIVTVTAQATATEVLAFEVLNSSGIKAQYVLKVWQIFLNFFIFLCPGLFSGFLYCLLTFFIFNFIKKFFQEHCQTVWIQIRTDILSVLIWVQTVCKGLQQTTKVAVTDSGFRSGDDSKLYVIVETCNVIREKQAYILHFSGLMILIPAKGNLMKIVYIFYTRFLCMIDLK